MSLENLDTWIAWAKKRGQPANVQLLGGEPMLHPQILEFVKRLQESNVKIETIITNGLGETNLYKAITEISKTGWLVNVDNPQSYSIQEWELLNRNLEILRWKGKRSMKENGFDQSVFNLQFAITFYKPKQEYSYIIDLAKKYDAAYIRCDASRPAKGKCNAYVDFEHLAGLKPTLMNFFRDCVREEIKPNIDDAWPPCIFTQSEMVYILLFVNRFHSVCFPSADVFPDLTVEYCASMRGIMPAYNLKEHNLEEVSHMHLYNAQAFRNITLPHCKDCRFFMNKECQGYCLQYKNDFLEKKFNSEIEQAISTTV